VFTQPGVDAPQLAALLQDVQRLRQLPPRLREIRRRAILQLSGGQLPATRKCAAGLAPARAGAPPR
jgi:hypothetical protein